MNAPHSSFLLKSLPGEYFKRLYLNNITPEQRLYQEVFFLQKILT